MAKKTWRCKVCKEKNDIGDLECVATENCDGVRPKPRVVTNPAQYTIFKEMTAEEAAKANPTEKVLVGIAVVKGPAIARKDVEDQKIAGHIMCFRGPVWEDTYGVQEVFGILDQK